MNDLVEFEEVSLDKLASFLSDAVIDFDRTYHDCLYVTGGEFPVFWSIESNHDALVFWTFLDATEGADEIPCVIFANECNLEFNMVQFSYHTERRRFYGHYVMMIKEGLNRKQAIRTGRRFSEIFAKAAAIGVSKCLLQPIDNDTDSPTEISQAAANSHN